MRPEDDFTSTVDGAEAYERWRAENDYEDFDDGLGDPPDDVGEDGTPPEGEGGHRPGCNARDFSECIC